MIVIWHDYKKYSYFFFFAVIKLRKIVKIFNKIRLIDFNAHKYSFYAHINNIIFIYYIWILI